MNENYFIYALDSDGEICSAASSGKEKDYFCPACGESVILRKGKIKIHHFAHRANVEGVCSPETVIHKIAKLLIKQVVQNWINKEAESPEIIRHCSGCHKEIIQRLPGKVTGVELERGLKNGRIADIVLLSGNNIVSAIEIRVTHKVNIVESEDYEIKSNEKNEIIITKAVKVDNYGIPFIELEGKEVIENSVVWKPLVDKYKLVVCQKCKEGFIKFFDVASRIAKRDGILLPKDFYIYGLTTCWKCKREILVFDWEHQESWSKKKPEFEPMPKSIKFRYSNMIDDSYWVNTCPRCHAIQGEYFLKDEVDSPFFGLKNPEGSFKEKIYEIAMKQGRWIKDESRVYENVE